MTTVALTSETVFHPATAPDYELLDHAPLSNGLLKVQLPNEESSGTPPLDVLLAEEPSAPPLDLLDVVPGYEGLTFEPVDIPPPPLAEDASEDQPLTQTSPSSGPAPLTEGEARQALLRYVDRRWCYSRQAARSLAVTSLEPSSAFHYTLESYTEKRQTSWFYEAYTGGAVDGPENGIPPPTWEVPVPRPSAPFQSEVERRPVPHTSSVKSCHGCGGLGRRRCQACAAGGWERCTSCLGDGRKTTSFQGDTERCFHCHGTGRRKCILCNGEGKCTCTCCEGTGQILCYIMLTVSWNVHTNDHIVEKRSRLPEDLVKDVMGPVVFEEELPRVQPLNNFPDTTISLASSQLVQQQAQDLRPCERILLQRHSVRMVPVTRVHYQWKEKEGFFVVYGLENQVYAPDYPQKCCCTII